MIWVCWAVGFERDLRKKERREKGRGTETDYRKTEKVRDKIVFEY